MKTLSKTVPTFTCVKLKIGSQGEVFFGGFSYMFTGSICQIEIQHFLILVTPLQYILQMKLANFHKNIDFSYNFLSNMPI